MKTRLTLKPGQPGTKREVRKYGGLLLAVRFRYDADRRLRFKTVELIEEQKPWVPTLSSLRSPDEKVFVRSMYKYMSYRKSNQRWTSDLAFRA
jgi:hypothetical protein